MNRDTSIQLHWPYDEVRISSSSRGENCFHLTSPWLCFEFSAEGSVRGDVLQVINKLAREEMAPNDLPVFDRVFSSLAEYPVSYLLPRQIDFGTDAHNVSGATLDFKSPRALFLSLFANSKDFSARSGELSFSEIELPTYWTWDFDVAVDFSRSQCGVDPIALFTVMRRFHLLDDLEHNQTGRLFAYIQALSPQSPEAKEASALVLRQNHYITERCEEVLSAALAGAQSAADQIREFIQAESGHDKILRRSLNAVGVEPMQIPVSGVSVALMDLFKAIAQKNILAFSAVVDVFERTSYKAEDPMTTVLNSAGLKRAGAFVDAHREINDRGEHENVAMQFLKNMRPVDKSYAEEAFRLAELNTMVINRHSRDLLCMLGAIP